MKDYTLYSIDNEIFQSLCFINVVEDVYAFLDEIIDEIKKIEVNKILIDLFMRNGYGFNRYIELSINGQDIQSAIINPRDVSERVKNISAQHLLKYQYLLGQTALSQSSIEIIIAQLKKKQLSF